MLRYQRPAWTRGVQRQPGLGPHRQDCTSPATGSGKWGWKDLTSVTVSQLKDMDVRETPGSSPQESLEHQTLRFTCWPGEERRLTLLRIPGREAMSSRGCHRSPSEQGDPISISALGSCLLKAMASSGKVLLPQRGRKKGPRAQWSQAGAADEGLDPEGASRPLAPALHKPSDTGPNPTGLPLLRTQGLASTTIMKARVSE